MKKLILSIVVAATVALSAQAKSLVVYFSWGGTTEKMANMIASSTGADLWKVEPTEAYPTAYRPCTEVVKDELEKGIVRTVKNKPDFANYDTVFVGVPVWWHTAPTLVTNLLRESGAALSGKTVVPFCTYAATYRDETLAALVDATPGAKHKDGYGTKSPAQSDVDAWLRRIGEKR